MEFLNILSAFGLSASAGLNAYIPLLIVALLARFTNLIHLSEPWNALTSWWVIGLLVVLSLVEFFADKIPAVNHANDLIQTFIRPVAGAILFAASAHVVTEVHPHPFPGVGPAGFRQHPYREIGSHPAHRLRGNCRGGQCPGQHDGRPDFNGRFDRVDCRSGSAGLYPGVDHRLDHLAYVPAQRKTFSGLIHFIRETAHD